MKGCSAVRDSGKVYREVRHDGDKSTLAEILRCGDGREVKQLGRRVKNFDERRWTAERERIVRAGNRQKFRQCPAMRDELLKYDRGSVFVECSGSDRVWGIGFSERNFDPSRMKSKDAGQNLLGRIISEIRMEFP